MILVLLAVFLTAAVISLALVVVVAGIRQEPPWAELSSRPQARAAALARRLMGVSVRRPDSPADDDHHGDTTEPCVAGRAGSTDGR